MNARAGGDGRHDNLASRLWRKDASLWRASPGDFAAVTAGLGWLECIDWMRARADALSGWAAAQAGRYERAILLGMGGASLAPAVMASLFAPAPGGIALRVVDTTHPDDIARVADSGLRGCLFIVASKSGETRETLDLYAFFRERLAARVADADSHFVIITDANSHLHRLGESRRAAKIFLNPANIGGRYSALSYFGMAPAALLGVDVAEVLARARDFCATTKSDVPAENPALALGLLLGRAALCGRDTLILRMPRRLGAFGMWIEQLIAESCGKEGKGLLPVVAAGEAECGGDDRIIARINIGRDSAPRCAGQFAHPLQIGAEFFRWEVATAIAAACLRVNPFDQPDVAQAKDNTRAQLAGRAGARIALPVWRGDEYDLHCHPGHCHPAAARAHDNIIADFCAGLAPPYYLALLAYLPQDDDTMALLQSVRARAAAAFGAAVTLGMGPRYLHSTGQFHKGGPRRGRFIQFIADAGADLPVPGREYTFGELHRAQADGDFAALAACGAPVLRVRLKTDRLRALHAFACAFPAKK
ncbi:MAG: hypothetical protein OD918_00995 [Gammaproteobacteria bacterium]